MSSEIQTIAALVIVAVAATWLVVRFFRKDKSACGHDCGCPSVSIKAKLKR
jgi:hypothetical protein